MNILDVISEINKKFNEEYSNAGFLKNTKHTATSFFTTQACWYYAYILKKLFPEGEIYLGSKVPHVIFGLGNDFYDVGGYYYFYNENHFYPDKEVIGSVVYEHPEHRDVMNLCTSIISDIKGKNKRRVR
ncbi:MAG TPA: hypothetical protein GX713_04990 [Mollicutes bacterium]|nr:hypothetical protein [Mollicutes bacterium]